MAIRRIASLERVSAALINWTTDIQTGDESREFESKRVLKGDGVERETF